MEPKYHSDHAQWVELHLVNDDDTGAGGALYDPESLGTQLVVDVDHPRGWLQCHLLSYRELVNGIPYKVEGWHQAWWFVAGLGSQWIQIAP